MANGKITLRALEGFKKSDELLHYGPTMETRISVISFTRYITPPSACTIPAFNLFPGLKLFHMSQHTAITRF